MSTSTVLVREVAPGVYGLTLGRRALASNVYLVAGGDSWALVDAAWAGNGATISQAATTVFGADVPPAAILLTHIHPDHSGAARWLAQLWHVPVFAHPAELPLAAGRIIPQYANPLDRWVLGPLLRLMPARTRARMVAAGALTDLVQPLDPAGEVPGLPGWRCIPTPGHTPGHVAYFRPSDRLLLTGDAALTVDLNTLRGFLHPRSRVSGPPRYTTWSWPAAVASIAWLAELQPRILAPGHGPPLHTGIPQHLQALAERHGRHLARGQDHQPVPA